MAGGVWCDVAGVVVLVWCGVMWCSVVALAVFKIFVDVDVVYVVVYFNVYRKLGLKFCVASDVCG